MPITVAKARKQIPTMLTLGKVRVIGDSGALQIAIRQQIWSAPGLDLFSGPLSLTQQANGYAGRAWVRVAAKVEWVGWSPYH